MLNKNMIQENKLDNIRKLKEDYLKIRELVLYYKNIYENNLQFEKENQKEEVKVKKLVLNKPFYGKNLVVG